MTAEKDAAEIRARDAERIAAIHATARDLRALFLGKGGCKVLSLGSACVCPLCLIDRLEAIALASPETETPALCGRAQTPPGRAEGMTCTRVRGHDGPCAMDWITASPRLSDARLLEFWRSVSGPHAALTGPLRFAGKVQDARAGVEARGPLRALLVELVDYEPWLEYQRFPNAPMQYRCWFCDVITDDCPDNLAGPHKSDCLMRKAEALLAAPVASPEEP